MQGFNNSKIQRAYLKSVKEVRDLSRPAAIIKQGSLHPFKRAAELYTAIIETRARLQDNLFELHQALADFPPYTSRGHGWKGRIKNRTITGRWNQDRSKYVPHTGKKELDKAAYCALPVHLRNEVNGITRQLMDELDPGCPVKPHQSGQESFT